MKKLKILLISLTASVSMMLCSCGSDPFEHVKANHSYEDYTLASGDAGYDDDGNAVIESPEEGEIPGRHGNRIHVNNIGRLREVFNDSNRYHYEAAERIGIAPIHSLAEAYYTRRPIVKIESCEWYTVDSLTHSLPFLVPEAAKLLEDIGRNFRDSLTKRGGDNYRIRVTSLLRTPHTVKRLRRVNRNATDSSTHQFGTTFDLTYTRFDCLDSSRVINDGDLKNLLAEVLLDLRRQNRCLVKFERRSPCFHITAVK